ncbi:bifunctional non-homologous end joining protein LigD [Sporomusaceae bacterium BoRhaA]|uniref:non-homologous end-joining DNA ligase n=1 Tax=Pelorhabdus rhamnosifermentans TaxID=2772457 RepID=UPI001C06266A|nr:non-homologous end-joining DNA ligase [Pelorhabdus rhamnosifermentans]MBU2702327.1 bifunctional non-homologous end joining protein LigD [Pelorhabdus rhamnosifermentans]
MPNNTVLDIAGTQLTLSNLEKVFYPKSGFNKKQMIDYYIRISPFLLPHLAGRPLTLKRYPHGSDGKFFYQKECPASRPEWLSTTPIWSKSNNKHICYCVVDNLSALVWTANMAALELHTSLSSSENIDVPTMMVFDLDPGWPATIVECTQVALWLLEFFAKANLQSYPKTSGSKGLQIYVPLNTPVDYSQTKSLAHKLAQMLEKKFPNQVVSKMNKNLRPGKVFIDWSQNDPHKTTVCVYSLRAREEPTVSTPVTWLEIEQVWKSKDAEQLVFTAAKVLERVKNMGDLFAPVLTTKQYLS